MTRRDGVGPLGHPALPVALLLLIFGLATAVVLWSGSELRFPDEEQYLSLATHLAETGIYSLDGERPTAFRPPVYPLLLAALVRLGAGVVVLKLLNVLALGLSALVLYRFLRRRGFAEWSVLGLIGVLAYPVLLYTASTLYPQAITGLLLLGFVFTAFDAERRPAALTTGALCYGLLIMIMPVFALMLSVVIPALLFFHGVRPGIQVTGVLLLAITLVITPWAIRNWRVFDAFVPLSTNGGLVLLRGNAPDSRGDSGVNVDITEHIQAAKGMTEVERSRYFRQIAVDRIQRDKPAALRLYLSKVVNFFNFRNQLHVRAEGTDLRSLVMFVTYYPLLGLLALRYLSRRRWPIERWELVLTLLYLSSALFMALFFTRIRYRLPLDLLLITLAAAHLARLLGGDPGPRSQLR